MIKKVKNFISDNTAFLIRLDDTRRRSKNLNKEGKVEFKVKKFFK